MKNSLDHLPENKKEDLRRIAQYVVEEIPDVEMLILYGSYARGNYVDYDQRTEFGMRTYFMSDYDIMVVLKTYHSISRVLERVEDRYRDHRHPTTVTPIQFITETIGNLNKAIDKGHYFYTDIKKEGIMLYDSGRYQLAESRKLNFAEIKAWAEVYFGEKFASATEFLNVAKYCCSQDWRKKASFMLHQSIENYYLATILTYTLYSEKEHNLTKLAAAAKTHCLETTKAFPRNTPEEVRLFDLLEKAYVQARYNPHFHVTKEDIEAIIPKVELLRDITEQTCCEKINYYQTEIFDTF